MGNNKALNSLMQAKLKKINLNNKLATNFNI